MQNISRRSFVATLGSALTVVMGTRAFGATKPKPKAKKKVVKKAKPVSTKTTSPSPAAPALAPIHVNNAPATLSDVPIGESLSATYLDPKTQGVQSIVLHRMSALSVVGFSAICTHRGCTVAFSTPTSYDCPCHGSSYNSQTGAVLNGPALRPLKPLEVKVQDGALFIAS